MPIYKWRGEYWYGYGWPPGGGTGGNKKSYIRLWTRINDKGEKYGFEVRVDKEKDPIGTPMLNYSKKIWPDEQEDPELPKNYPGDYYWVWYNGAFFKVLGETERYVLVDVQGGNDMQADALGIPREKVYGVYYDGAEVERWWIKKKDIKMPDEFGKGKYVYIWMDYYRGVYPVVEKKDGKIRVRGVDIYTPWLFEEIKEDIEKGIFPWPNDKYRDLVIKEGADVWKEGEWLYYEATFDIETMRKIRKEKRLFDFYLYGEEDVPYRL